MSRTSRRAAMGVAFILGVSPLLGACAAGQGAVSRMAYAPSDGVQGQVGPIKVLNALVVAGPDGAAGTIAMSVVNTGTQPDEIVGISSSSGAVTYDGPSTVPAQGTLQFGGAAPSATIDSLKDPAGTTIGLTVQFKDAGEVALETVVYPATGDYATITPQATTPVN